MTKILPVSEKHKGMYLHYVINEKTGKSILKGMYWFFGQGYYRTYPDGKTVYRDGKRVLVLPKGKKKLKNLIKQTELNLF